MTRVQPYDYSYDERVALKLIHFDVHGHYPEYDVFTMNIYDVRETYIDLWEQYKTLKVREVFNAN